MSIEDAIKRCEQLIKPENASWIGLSNQSAISHILKDYTMLEEIEEEHKKINGKLRKEIENLKELDKTNNDLRLLYRRTANKLLENGKDELAGYFLAQINEVPTFTVDDDIDYYKEYYKLKEKVKKIEEIVFSNIHKGTVFKDEYIYPSDTCQYVVRKIVKELLQESED